MIKQENILKQAVVALAVAAAFSAFSVSAAPVATGSIVHLADGVGSGPGGEFNASVISGAGMGESFVTFCLEYNETFSYGQDLRVQAVNTGSVNGGVSRLDVTYAAYTFSGSLTPTSTFDPLSYGTAYLYTMFRTGNLSGYGGANHVADANSLQNAIWFIEGEKTLSDISGDAQALTWVTEAKNANWSSYSSIYGTVSVLNLNKKDSNNLYTLVSQDQLYFTPTPVPEPETYALMLGGLGFLGFMARRRRKNSAS